MAKQLFNGRQTVAEKAMVRQLFVYCVATVRRFCLQNLVPPHIQISLPSCLSYLTYNSLCNASLSQLFHA